MRRLLLCWGVGGGCLSGLKCSLCRISEAGPILGGAVGLKAQTSISRLSEVSNYTIRTIGPARRVFHLEQACQDLSSKCRDRLLDLFHRKACRLGLTSQLYVIHIQHLEDQRCFTGCTKLFASVGGLVLGDGQLVQCASLHSLPELLPDVAHCSQAVTPVPQNLAGA